MTTPENQTRILSVDDDPTIHLLLQIRVDGVGNIETLDSKDMDVRAAVEAIRAKLEDLDVLILDGNYKGNERTQDQSALELIQALESELSSRGITVIVYSSGEEILRAVKNYYPSVATIAKPQNFDLIKEAVLARVPFQTNAA